MTATLKKVLRKVASYSRIQDLRSSKYTFLRLTPNTSSLPRRLSISSSGVSPLPTRTDDVLRSISEKDPDSKAILQKLVECIESTLTSDPGENRREEIRACLESNLPLVGNILDKIGGSANGQVPVSGTAAESSSHFSDEVARIFKGLGRFHPVGSILIVVAAIMQRFSRVSKNDKELLKYRKKLRYLAKFFLQIWDGFPSSEADETLQEAFLQICDHAVFFHQKVKTKKSLVTRLWSAEYDYEKLVEMQKEIDDLQSHLKNVAWQHEHIHSTRVTENIEPSEDTVSVGNEKRVEEAMQKLNNSYSVRGVRAFVLFGMLGVGKSTVGEQLVAELRKSQKFDSSNICKLSMGNETKAVSVNKLQQELLRKLLGSGVLPNFSDPADGRQKLRNLFRNRFLNKPVLLYFDKVHKVEDLDLLVPEKLDTLLHPESILLVTTPNQGVISLLKSKSPGVITLSCEVKALEEQHANALLLRKLFGDMDIHPNSVMVRDLMNFEENGVLMMRKLLKICGGVPLAIICVGSHIWRRGHTFLRSHIEELKLHNLSFEEAYAELNKKTRALFMERLKDAVRHACKNLSYGDRISQDALHRTLEFACNQLKLDPRIQEVFLEIVHVHVGSRWTDVELIYGADELETLKHLSMVSRLVYKDGTSSPILHVHDLLVGAGRKMANLDFKGRWVVLDNEDDVHDYFNNDLPECFRNKELYRPKAFVAKLENCNEELQLSAEQLDHIMTRDLQFLELQHTKIAGSCSNVPPNLKYFKSRWSSLPFPLQNLQSMVVVVDVDLHMDTTSNLESIESLPHLQKLTLRNSFSLRKIGSGLQNMTALAIHNCPNFMYLDSDASALQQLEIVDCSRFSDFSGVSTLIMKGVERLSLEGFLFTKFPETLEIPARVQVVDLSRNKNLEAMPKFAPENKIRILNLGSCSCLQEVSDIHSTRLECLVLGGCTSLEQITVSNDILQTLRHLDVQGCPKEELKPSIDLIADRTAAGFRLIGWEMAETDDTPVGSCAIFKRCLKLSLKQTISILEKVPAGRRIKAPARRFKPCCTFPPSADSKFN